VHISFIFFSPFCEHAKSLFKWVLDQAFQDWVCYVKCSYILRMNWHVFVYLSLWCSISHVEVMGRPLSPEFDVKVDHPSGKCTLKYHAPPTDPHMSPSTSSPDSGSSLRLRIITSSIVQRGVRRWEQILLGALLGSGSAPAVVDDWWKKIAWNEAFCIAQHILSIIVCWAEAKFHLFLFLCYTRLAFSASYQLYVYVVKNVSGVVWTDRDRDLYWW